MPNNFKDCIDSIFKRHASNYDSLIEQLSPVDQCKMFNLCHFYYFICCPDNKNNYVREELQIIGLTSLMEAMMSSGEYVSQFEYLKMHIKDLTILTSHDIAKIQEEYYREYGLNNKVKKYFELYVDKNDAATFLGLIRKWNDANQTLEPLKNIFEFSDLLYKMRSEFVHKAEMRYFCPDECFASLIRVGNAPYDIRVKMPMLLELFEKSFVKYWTDKVKELASATSQIVK